MKPTYVWMIQCGDCLRLTFESLSGFSLVLGVLRKNLDCNGAIEPRISSLVHFAHTACPNRGQYFVRSKLCAWKQ